MLYKEIVLKNIIMIIIHVKCIAFEKKSSKIAGLKVMLDNLFGLNQPL